MAAFHVLYDTFGGVTRSTGSLNYGYRGQETRHTLVDLGNRWYDTANGRWISPPPFGAGESNGYRYLQNNPLTNGNRPGALPADLAAGTVPFDFWGSAWNGASNAITGIIPGIIDLATYVTVDGPRELVFRAYERFGGISAEGMARE